MKILVTGANGMVAGSVIRQSLAAGDDVIGLSRESLDIADRKAVFDSILTYRPDAVINCAAFTDVDGAEAAPERAFAVNESGVRNLAAATATAGCVFVTISTDYVFDGQKSGFYTQRDLPAPLGVYGKSKRAGEIAAFSENAASIIVRSGWIFGLGGKNFLSKIPDFFRNQTPFTAIADAFGTPTYSEDLAGRLRELAAAALPGVYHITNAGPGTSYFGFAEAVRNAMNTDAESPEPIESASLNRPAPRPLNSRLACLISEKLGFPPMPDWQDAIRRFVKSFSEN
jgi:dTDP-4-dehydrorhamnose reductase